MLYGEIIAVCSEIRTKHTNTLCGQELEFVTVKHTVWAERRIVYKYPVRTAQ